MKKNIKILDSTIYNGDTLLVNLPFTYNCITASKGFDIFNKSYAYSCKNYCGIKGIKNPLLYYNVTANQNYRNIATGGTLNQFVKIKYITNFITIQQFIDTTNIKKFIEGGDFGSNIFEIVEKPTSMFIGKFTIKLKFANEDGSI